MPFGATSNSSYYTRATECFYSVVLHRNRSLTRNANLNSHQGVKRQIDVEMLTKRILSRNVP